MSVLESTRLKDSTVPSDLAQFLPLYAQIRSYVGFYPLGRNRKPLLAGFQSASTTDLNTLWGWMRMRRFTGFGAYIHSSQLLVLDLENPVKAGHCGYTTLINVLDDAGIKLPSAPSVRTAHGGWHLYLRIPDNTVTIRKHIALWPGIDILTLGSNVIQPGAVLEEGRYNVVSSFHEGLPDCPVHLLELIADRQQAHPCRRATVPPSPTPAPVPAGLTPTPVPPGLNDREWFRLRCNETFRRMWDLRPKAFDNSASAYEYHIAKAVLAQGLSVPQAEGVIAAWRNRHNLWIRTGKGKRRSRQISAIVEAAWREVEEWVTSWQLQQESDKAQKYSTSARGQILELLSRSGPLRIIEVANLCGFPYDKARKALGRLEADGMITRRGGLYAAAHYTIDRTKSGITTPCTPFRSDSQKSDAAPPSASPNNSPHGRRRGRRRSSTTEMAEAYLRQDPQISNGRLAELVGVPPAFVAVLRHRIKNRAKQSNTEEN